MKKDTDVTKDDTSKVTAPTTTETKDATPTDSVSENEVKPEGEKKPAAKKTSKPAVKKEAVKKEAKPAAEKTSKDEKPGKAPAKKAAVKTEKAPKSPVKKATKSPAAKKTTAKPAVKKEAKAPVAKAKPAKADSEKRSADNFGRNFGRVKFNGETFSKGRAVLAVVAAFVEKKKPTTAQLKTAFPDEIIKNYGIVQKLPEAKKYSVNGKTRFFVNEGDVIQTKDGKVAVCNQISSDVFKSFSKHAKTMGFTLTPVAK